MSPVRLGSVVFAGLAPVRHADPGARRQRRGLTLLEVLVAVAIMMIFTAVLVPSLDAVLLLEQRGAARRLALVYEQLHDEAVLRNKTYRVVYHLDQNFYQVEVGDAGATIFTSSKAREAWEERDREKREDMTPEELREYEDAIGFQAAQGELGGKVELPQNTVFGSVYTPQYTEPQRPREPGDRRSSRDDDEGANVVYSYIFSNGFSEYTVVQMVDRDDEEEGFTISVAPLSGTVTFHSELIDHHDAFDFVPDDGPRLNL